MLLTLNATSGAVDGFVGKLLNKFYPKQLCQENIKRTRCCHQKSHIWLV